MSLDYIRRCYNVPAKRGVRVRYTGGKEPKEGVIVGGANGGYLSIRLDGEKLVKPYHPTWQLEYLTEPE